METIFIKTKQGMKNGSHEWEYILYEWKYILYEWKYILYMLNLRPYTYWMGH